MLPAKNRLNLAFYKPHKARLVKGALLDVYVEQAGGFRAAVKVSKKTAPKAVDRNRIRRIVLEALLPYTENLKASVVVVTKKNFANLKTQDVKTEFAKLLRND